MRTKREQDRVLYAGTRYPSFTVTMSPLHHSNGRGRCTFPVLLSLVVLLGTGWIGTGSLMPVVRRRQRVGTPFFSGWNGPGDLSQAALSSDRDRPVRMAAFRAVVATCARTRLREWVPSVQLPKGDSTPSSWRSSCTDLLEANSRRQH
jgi:hypothetical protein